MPNARARITGASPDGSAVNILVEVIPGPEGLESFKVLDSSYAPITDLISAACQRDTFVFEIPEPVAAFRLPILIEARDCGHQDEQPVLLGPYIERGQPVSGGGLWCPPPGLLMTSSIPVSAQCVNARTQLSNARNSFSSACLERNRRRGDRDHWRTLTIGLWVIHAAAVIAASIISAIPPFGWVFGIVIYVFATVIMAAAIWTSVQLANAQADLDTAQASLDAAAENFNAASRDVMASCCPSDYTREEVILPMC